VRFNTVPGINNFTCINYDQIDEGIDMWSVLQYAVHSETAVDSRE
jgi:hypothetical protein